MLKNLSVSKKNTDRTISDELQIVLEKLRNERNFNVKNYIRKKANILNLYMRRSALSTCIVALSGGVDSATVLALIKFAAAAKGSPIKRVVAVTMPVFSKKGATNQKKTTLLSHEVALKYNVPLLVVNLTAVHRAMKLRVDKEVKTIGGPWAEGQLVSYIRTPALYYLSSVYAQKGMPAIICGTTNRDEGAYLGYFGKASDGMVDVQLISDIHKSEVYAVAHALDVPAMVIQGIPSGDMFDGRTDEEIFGLPYDVVELFLLLKTKSLAYQSKVLRSLSPKSSRQLTKYIARIEEMHRASLHKYLGSPAIHLNVYETHMPGGWIHKRFSNP